MKAQFHLNLHLDRSQKNLHRLSPSIARHYSKPWAWRYQTCPGIKNSDNFDAEVMNFFSLSPLTLNPFPPDVDLTSVLDKTVSGEGGEGRIRNSEFGMGNGESGMEYSDIQLG